MSRAAMQQALEALVAMTTARCGGEDGMDISPITAAYNSAKAAIPVLRAALAEQAQMMDVERAAFEGWFCSEDDVAPTWNNRCSDGRYTHVDVQQQWEAWQARAKLARTSPVHQPVHGWTDADADAARLALELECLLTDGDMPTASVSRWWESAHEALRLHRERLDTTPPAPGQKGWDMERVELLRKIKSMGVQR